MASLKVVLLFLLVGTQLVEGRHVKHQKRSDQNREKQLLVLAPPIKLNGYYKEKFQSVIPFYKRYVQKIQEGTDEVVLVADEETMPYYTDIDPTVRLMGHIDDPWVRDVSPPIPSIEVQFRYVGGSTQTEADKTQGVYNKFIKSHNINPDTTPFKVDGGNMVNNNGDAVITTRKFMTDNGISTKEEAVYELKRILGVEYVSILTQDEPKLAHSDGMAAFVCEDSIYMHKQSEPGFNELVRKELEDGCPHCKITEVEGFLDKRLYKEGYASSCGVYVNAVVTNNYIYVPQFGKPDLDKAALDQYTNNGCGKKAVPIDVREVCVMGGSLRCLSWQTEGDFANKLKVAAAADAGGGNGGEGGESVSGEEYAVGENYKKKEEFDNIEKILKNIKKELENIEPKL